MTDAIITRKVTSPDSGDFSETIRFKVLNCADVSDNHNKFYCIEIQRNPKTGHYRLFTHYGRLGTSNIYEIREQTKGGYTLTESVATKEFEKIVKNKTTRKSEPYTEVDVLTSSVGSTNIRHSTTVNVSAPSPKVKTDGKHPDVQRIIRQVISENIHNVTANTTFSFTSRGFETPLGPVTEQHIQRARDTLGEITGLMGTSASIDDTQPVRAINSRYFSLIPHKFGSKITVNDMILTVDKLTAEYELLDQLQTAVKMGLNDKSNGDDGQVDLDLSILDRQTQKFVQLDGYFESTKHRSHSQLHKYNVKHIFNVLIPHERQKYTQRSQQLGNIRELFHGTKTPNVLSILLNGLMVPPTGAIHVTGRMFGNGVYGADCSTKALNYAVGYWSSSVSNRGDNVFMFIVNFAMGKEYVATTSQYSGPPAGYTGMWGKAGGALLNNEFIVYGPDQVTITHLLELQTNR